MSQSTEHQRGPGWVSLLRAARFLALACAALVAAFILLMAVGLRYSLAVPNVDIWPAMSRDEFERRHAGSEWPPLPQSAANIHYAHANVGFNGTETLLRFDAPLDDCAAFGEGYLRQLDPAAKLTPIASPPEPIAAQVVGAMGLKSVDWFDIDRIESGVQGGSDAPGQVPRAIWVDTARGRCYLRSSS